MKLLACIIETRAENNLQACINNHLKMLPDETHLAFFGSVQNSYIKDALNPQIHDFVTINNIDDYNRLLTSTMFWDRFRDYDRVLIFQTDSVIFRPGIEEFYPYDYVGAPWKFQQHGGNGGLSLRNPKTMLGICVNIPWEKHLGNEDVYFSNILERNQHYGKLAPRDVCTKFSVESIFALHSFGGHAYWKYLSEVESNQITYQYS